VQTTLYFLLSTYQPHDDQGITLYPNPTKDKFRIESRSDIISYALSDMAGKILIQGIDSSEINVSGFDKGMYILKVETSEGIGYKKLIVE
jgi:hypothetical protein